MNLLLYERTTLRTALGPAQIGERLARNVQPIQWFPWSKSKASHFQGRLDPSAFHGNAASAFEVGSHRAFKIMVTPKGRDSFVPVIEGYLTSMPEGTRLRVTIRLHLFTLAFLVFWTVMLSRSGGPPPVKMVMSALAWGMCLVFFNLGRRRAKTFLLELLEGTEVEESDADALLGGMSPQ